jgi:LuxR family transcriptional regulator, maltose regulon positive regulatory protein
MAEDVKPEIPAARRHIIERPRLTRLLDETTARVIMLVAPAGYGKTTLARQWLVGRPHAWYQAVTASSDIAALALGLAECASRTRHHDRKQLRQWLKATREPQQEVTTAAELLTEEFNEWPDDRWLVIDDYHLLASPASESLIDQLLQETNFPLLLTSRVRPAWATPRRLLYGEFHEIGQHALAMNEQEAIGVLSGDDAAGRALMTLAGGWPAVIGLAAFADLSDLLEQDRLPSDLHDYIADELFASLDADTRDALCRIALLPELTPALTGDLLQENEKDVLANALRAGFLIPTDGGSPELHPLLRSFLLEKLDHFDSASLFSIVSMTFELLLQAEAWEEAFDLLARFHRYDLLEVVVSASLEDLVDNGRIETLKAWSAFGRERGLASPVLDLLEAECCFRGGRHDRAKVLATRAAELLASGSKLVSTALSLAGQSAHLADAPKEAREYFTQARETAQTPRDTQKALWGQFITTVELGGSDAAEILSEFERASSGTVDELVRAHNGRLYLATRQGPLLAAIGDARPIVEVVGQARDPIVRVSFLHIYSGALRLATEYEPAQQLVTMSFDEVDHFRLDFARPHILLTRAAVYMGTGELPKASAVLDRVDELSERSQDDYLAMSAATLRCRLLLAEGSPEKALAVTQKTWPRVRAPGQRAELLASRALAVSQMDDRSRAHDLLAQAERLSDELETTTLSGWVRVLLTLAEDDQEGRQLVRTEFEKTVSSGLTDTFVFAYRMDQRVLEELQGEPSLHDVLIPILLRARDGARAKAAGLRVASMHHGQSTHLTQRERDVYALICDGRTNREIAKALFLSEVTVKVHVRNILRKLGVRTRTEAAVLGLRTPEP